MEFVILDRNTQERLLFYDPGSRLALGRDDRPRRIRLAAARRKARKAPRQNGRRVARDSAEGPTPHFAVVQALRSASRDRFQTQVSVFYDPVSAAPRSAMGGARDDAAAMRNAQSALRADDEVSPEATNGSLCRGRQCGIGARFTPLCSDFGPFSPVSLTRCMQKGRVAVWTRRYSVRLWVNSPLPQRGTLTAEWLIAFIPV